MIVVELWKTIGNVEKPSEIAPSLANCASLEPLSQDEGFHQHTLSHIDIAWQLDDVRQARVPKEAPVHGIMDLQRTGATLRLPITTS